MKAKMNNVRGGEIASKKLLAAIAVLAVAFAVFAAVPVIADDSDAADGKTIYVNPNTGDDKNDGTSSDKALKTFDVAFDKATANDKVQLVDNYVPTAAATGENDITIPAGETLVVPTSVTLDCSNVKLTVEGTLEVSGTLTIDRQNIAGADKTGACNIVIKGGATVNVGSAEVIGPSALTGGAELVISKLEPAAAGAVAHGYTATLKSGKLSLGTTDSTFTVGVNTNLTIDKDAEVELNGAITFDKGDGKSKGSITNNGTLTISTGGSVDSTKGTFTNNGTVVLNGGTFDGSISSGDVSFAGEITSDTRFPDMKGATFLANGNEYLVFDYEFNGKYYQYGLAVKDIAYNGTEILSDELSVIPIALPEDNDTVLTIYNTSASWNTKEKGVYKGALEVAGQKGDSPDAGYYEKVVYFEGSIDSVAGDKTIFKGNTLSKFLGLTVTKGQYDAELEIEGWDFGKYDEKKNAPTVTVTDADGKLVPADAYTVSYEYFSDKECKKSEGTDPLMLKPGTYYVKATVVPDNKNYEVKKIDAVEFKVVRASEVEFHPIQDLGDSETEKAILGEVDPDKLQKDNIKFNSIGKNADGQNVLRVSGTVYKIAADANELATLKSLFGSESSKISEGYFLAFYISGTDGQKLTDKDVYYAMKGLTGSADTTNTTNIVAYGLDVGDYKNEKGYVFGILYMSSLQADDKDIVDPVAGKNGFTCNVDYDKESGKVYNETKYLVDASFLNCYAIVLHDNKDGEDGKDYYNDTLTYYRVNGAQFTLPSGAGDGFKYWTTEEKVINDRVFSFGSVMIVGEEYDTDLDGTINLYAAYGSGSEPTPVEPTTGKIIVTGFVQDGKAYFTVIADDGLAIPAGTLTVSYTFDDPVFGSDTKIVETLEVKSGAQFATIAVDVPEGAITIFANYDDVKSNVFFI